MIESLSASGRPRPWASRPPGSSTPRSRPCTTRPNINWRNEPFREKLAGPRRHVEITVDNDANAAGWAEFRFGAGRLVQRHGDAHHRHRRRRRDRRRRPAASAAASAPAPSSATSASCRTASPCGCGQRGCIEQYGSGRALLRMANEIADAGGIGQTLARGARGARRARRPPRRRAHRAGGPGCASRPCANSATGSARPAPRSSAVLDPQRFVFGGGVAVAGELLLGPIREAYLEHLPARGYHPEPRLRDRGARERRRRRRRRRPGARLGRGTRLSALGARLNRSFAQGGEVRRCSTGS